MKSLFFFYILTITACSEPDVLKGIFEGEWSLPRDHILDGGPGLDGIPSIDNPQFIEISEVDFLEENSLVAGIVINGEARAYPHNILDYHEIINDSYPGRSISLTYCPLTGTAIAWDRDINQNTTTFGVSGLLYNSNLIAYDRSTNTAYSQILFEGVNGRDRGKKLSQVPVIETNWSTWKLLFPHSKVLSQDTGFSRNYSVYPYFAQGQDYRIQPFLIFPVTNKDKRRSLKERTLGVVVQGVAKAYPIGTLEEELEVRTDQVNGMDIIVIGSQQENLMLAFNARTSDNMLHTFSVLKDQYPLILADEEGNKWDVNGMAVEGPRKGEQLSIPESFIGYWFAWGAFYPAIELDE